MTPRRSADRPLMKLQRMVASAALVLSATAPCAAQGTFGLGARMSMIRGDVQVNPAATAQRFTGGQMPRRVPPKTRLEGSPRPRAEGKIHLTQPGREHPLQRSLPLFTLHSTFS